MPVDWVTAAVMAREQIIKKRRLRNHLQFAQLRQHIGAVGLDVDIGVDEAHNSLLINQERHARGALVVLLHRAYNILTDVPEKEASRFICVR
jgi:hypothetical protein